MRQCVVMMLSLCMVSFTTSAPLGRLPKRERENAPVKGRSPMELLASAAEMLTLHKPAHVYDMGIAADKDRLIDFLWKGDYISAAGRFTAANPALVAMFMEQSVDDSVARSDNLLRESKSIFPRFEFVLQHLFRSRSIRAVPIEAAALSIQFLHHMVPRIAWDTVAQFSRSVMSRAWTECLCEDALARDPGPPYPIAMGISAAVFDNFMIKADYGSYRTIDQHGHQFHMTNWASASIPQAAVPVGLDVAGLVAGSGIFRRDLSLSAFKDLFSPVAADIISHQRARWRQFLTNVDTLWDKEPFQSPYPQTHFHYHDPIFDRLQSSYEDVNFELDLMRSSNWHKYSDCIMLGGDGLSYMRLIHRLAQNPGRFLRTTPVVIPRLGEAPHGLFHVMHGDWRIWEPLIMRMARVVDNRQVKSDPSVSDFNTHRHFLRILTMAFSEYVVEIARTGNDFRNTGQFFRDAERNLSFSYICYFLWLFAFKYLEMRNGIRKNDSKCLDRIWRENLASARTARGNKTNYAKMSVILIYWGAALVGDLAIAFHNTRTLRWLDSHTGWDMFIEALNLCIKKAVTSHITEESICKFIRRLNFTNVVNRGLETVIRHFRKDPRAVDKVVRTDVDAIKEFLRGTIGTTYAQVTTASDANLMGIDLTDWGGDRTAREKRNGTPWAQMQRAMRDYRDYVQHKVADLCPWHSWQP